MRALFGGFLSLYLVGCAVLVKTPGTRLDSPETTGERHIKLEGALAGTNDVVLTSDVLATRPNTDSPTMDSGTRLWLGVGYGIAEKMEVSLRLPALIQFKFQALGESRNKAEAGNFPLAMTLSAGYESTKSQTESALGPKLAQSVRNDMKETTVDFGVVAGFRPVKELLFYGGPFISTINVSGTAEYLTPNSTTNYSGTITSKGANLGVELSNAGFQVRFEGALAHVTMGALSKSQVRVGLLLAYNFVPFPDYQKKDED